MLYAHRNQTSPLRCMCAVMLLKRLPFAWVRRAYVTVQVNEAQLQFGGTAAGSRYTYKPAALRAAPGLSNTSTGMPAVAPHRYVPNPIMRMPSCIAAPLHMACCICDHSARLPIVVLLNHVFSSALCWSIRCSSKILAW